MKKRRVGIVGGGASGMVAAITAAGSGAQVTILERGERVGKKILATGNGKCNLGNLNLSSAEYYGASKEWLDACLERFDTETSVQFFRGLGLLIKNKNGYLYPASEQAAVVLDVLRTELKTLGVQVITDCKVTEILKKDGELLCIGEHMEQYVFDKVILACGGKASPKTGSDGSGYKLAKKLGHHIVPTVPALVQLKCRETYLQAVAGVRCDGEIRVFKDGECIAKERGEIQLTEYGISGIPVFQISRIVNYLLRDNKQEVEVVLDLLPDMNEVTYEELKTSRVLLQSGRTAEEFFTGMLNKKIMMLFMKMAGLKPQSIIEDADKERVEAVYSLCRQWKLHVIGSNSYDNAQVCAGGVDTAEVTENMESKLVPGVYFAGELLDVDGKCGGYNLHWAWCSGHLAGVAAASSSAL